MTIFIVVVLILAAVVFVVVTIDKEKAFEAKNVQRLRDAYDQAIASGDKSKALIAGRAYYSAMRKGNLSIYDEQALTNDLSTMK